jgi:GNAT superfamily N-acetyltransferase
VSGEREARSRQSDAHGRDLSSPLSRALVCYKPWMFVNVATAARIERSEVETTRALAGAVTASGHAPDGFVRPFGAGVAAYVREGSPMNKVIGVGIEAPIDEATLAEVEAAMRTRGEPVRIELATLALAESGALLTARGYRLLGFENLLVRPLSAVAGGAPGGSGVRVERVTEATLRSWRDTTVEAVAASDDTGVPVDHLSLEAIKAVIDDFLECGDFDRYVAFIDGVIAGAASMRVHDGVASLTGSATLPAHRRRGVQAALIAARLAEAHTRGAEIATITTAPGSQSQANVAKHGFVLGYARAILVGEGPAV